MSKRLIAFALTVALVLSCAPTVAFAADVATATLNVEDVYATPGATVAVDIEIESNPGILGATLTVSWDEGLTLTDSANGTAFSELTFQAPSRYTSGCNFVWYGSSISQVVDGTVLTLTFEVPETAEEAQVYNITVTSDSQDIYDINYQNVELSINNGSVRIVTYTPGDVTSDDRINPLDLIKLSQYISDGSKTDPEGYNVTINESAADVNDDNRINPLDLIWISQYISDGGTDPEGFNRELLPHTPRCAHSAMEATEAKAATCTDAGNDAYWYCPDCDKYFSNESGTAEITLEDTVVSALGHNVVTVPGYAATKEETGLTDGKVCDRTGCDYVEVAQEEIPVITGYAINYEIANGEDYIEKNEPVIPADKMQYFEDTGLELPQLKVAGYKFIGWSTSQASSENIVTEIPAGTTGDKTFYAHWDPIVYTVTFDTPDVSVNGTKINGEIILNATEYTVDKGKDLPVPFCFGYTFMGWSDDNGIIWNRIKPGTTGHMTLRANWTSDRNKATSYQDYGEPIIIEDDTRGQFLFVYNIGKIDNVPLNEVEFIGKTESLDYNKTVGVVDTVNEELVDEINLMISNATTKSSGWTLSTDWNDLYSIQDETGSMKGISDVRTTTDGKTVGGKYFVSNSEGGSSHVSTESGSSASNSSKITTEDSFGINGSYDNSTDTYCDAKLGVTNETELSAGVKVKYGPAEASAGVKNTTTVSAETSSGRKDHTAVHYDSSVSGYVGTVNTSNSSSYFNSAISNDSNWNTTNSYESSEELFQEESVQNEIEEQLTQKTTHNLSQAMGGSDTNSAEISEQNRSDEQYNSRFTYYKGTQLSTDKQLTFNSSEPGYYRIITAGTIHVYGVVGYDVATSSYFTYCYNVLDDTTREIMDYSKDNMNFNDCENSIVAFDIPGEVKEYVSGVLSKTDGLEISYDGQVTGFKPDDSFQANEEIVDGETVIIGFNSTVVIPQYASKDNEDGSYSAVKVTSLTADTFNNVRDTVRTVVLPIYITEIPDYAFAGCTNLETVIAYGVTSIGNYAFKDCTSLSKFYVDNKITHLGEGAFENVSEVAIAAADSTVADAAIKCGAKTITLSVANITDTYENKYVEVPSTTENFTLIGDGSTYNNIELDSKATQSTMISNMVFANNVKTPIKIASETVTLARVTVENSPSFALILTGDNVNVKLLGTVTLNSATENAVLSRSVTLSQSQQSTTSAMVVNGKYLVAGEVTNTGYLNVTPTVITTDDFDSYLDSCIVTFDPNGGTVAEQTRTVYKNKTYGELPTPEKQYFAFDGWYTAAEGGDLITADSIIEDNLNHTLYAHWTPITATIEFDANGGEVTTQSKLAYIGEEVGELPTATRTHYSFNGWYTATSGGTQITAASVLTEAGTQTVYAQWDMVPYSVSWNTGTGYSITVKRTSSPNAGASTGTINNGTTVYYGDVLSVTYAASTGYTLTGSGKTAITVTGSVTSSDIYASVSVNQYGLNRTPIANCTVSVMRTSSPLRGAYKGALAGGDKIYYGDVLSVTYTAATGYSITETGKTSITVTGNVTSSDIWATMTANSYTYNIVYKSSNGTNLGGTTVTKTYGTTDTIYPPAISGYDTPASQKVTWDSTTAKTIEFIYIPSTATNATKSGTVSTSPVITYSATVEYQNRTANSVQIRVNWTATIAAYNYTVYGQRFVANVGSASTGTVVVNDFNTWKTQNVSYARTSTSSSGWITVPLNTTNATSVSMSVYYYQVNSNGTDMYKYNGTAALNTTWTINIPAY